MRAERAERREIGDGHEPAHDVRRELPGRRCGDVVEDVPVTHVRGFCTCGAMRECLLTRAVTRLYPRVREDHGPQGGDSVAVRRQCPCNANWAKGYSYEGIASNTRRACACG